MSSTKKPTGIKAMPSKREAPDDCRSSSGSTWRSVIWTRRPRSIRSCLVYKGGSSRGTDATSIVARLPCKCWMFPRTSQPHPAAKALYFTVKNLEAVFDRAQALSCLSREEVHDAPGGGIVVRPWGERSFYAEDPWGNPLCFVEEGTVYTG